MTVVEESALDSPSKALFILYGWVDKRVDKPRGSPYRTSVWGHSPPFLLFHTPASRFIVASYASPVCLADHSGPRRNHSRHAPRRRSDRTRPDGPRSSSSSSPPGLRTARSSTKGARGSVVATRRSSESGEHLDGSGGDEVRGLWVRDSETSSGGGEQATAAGACASVPVLDSLSGR